MKHTIVIVDDEQPARRLLENYISKIEFLELVGSFKSPLDTLSILKEQSVDILLLDIRMPEMSGLDFLKTIESPPAVILTTAYREYALEGYEHSVADYLVKPIEFSRFLKAINKLNAKVKKSEVSFEKKLDKHDKYLHLKSNKKKYKIDIKTVLYIQGENEYINYFLNNGKKLLIYGTLKDAENSLSFSQFSRVHRSYIVNLNVIEYVEGNRLFIKGKSIPISDTYKKSFLNKWK